MLGTTWGLIFALEPSRAIALDGNRLTVWSRSEKSQLHAPPYKDRYNSSILNTLS